MPSKQRIFDRYSENLAKFASQFQGRYACPLTLQLFEESNLDALSLEHCIPDGLGDDYFVLTDKKANNLAGSELDTHLHRMLRHIEFFRDGVGEIPIRMRIGDSVVGATFTRDMTTAKPHSHFQIETKTSNPKEIEEAQQTAAGGEFPREMPLFFHPNNRFDDRRAKVALLKAAYLMLFRELGYSLILHPAFQSVRRQIAEPDEDILPVSTLVVAVRECLPRPIFWVKEPADLFAFGCEFSITKGENSNPTLFRVLLPCSQHSANCWRKTSKGNHVYCFLRQDIDYIVNPRVWIENGN